jgi:hypothetical protein
MMDYVNQKVKTTLFDCIDLIEKQTLQRFRTKHGKHNRMRGVVNVLRSQSTVMYAARQIAPRRRGGNRSPANRWEPTYSPVRMWNPLPFLSA